MHEPDVVQAAERGAIQLLHTILTQAVKDALYGDDRDPDAMRTAREFLRGDGAQIIEALGIADAETVTAWAAAPTEPGDYITGPAFRDLIEAEFGARISVSQEVRWGRLHGYITKWGSPQYRIPNSEAARYIHMRRKGAFS